MNNPSRLYEPLLRKEGNDYLRVILFSFVFFVVCGVGTVGAVGILPSWDDDMTIYYHMNNNSIYGENQSYIYDFSLTGNNANNVNARFNYSDGPIKDGCFEFNASRYINISYSPSYNFSNTLQGTIMFWFRPQNTSSGLQDIINFKNIGVEIQFNSSTRKLTINWVNGSGTIRGYSSALTYGWNSWHHVGITFNFTNDTIIYGDGTLDRYIATNDGVASSGVIGYLGVQDSNYAKAFNGSLDEVIVFNRSLQDIDVLSIYNNYVGTLCNSASMIEGCSVLTDLTLNGTTMKVSGVNSSFRLSASNIVVDCNNTLIYGRNISSQYGITTSLNLQNITIKNCKFQDLYYGLNFNKQVMGEVKNISCLKGITYYCIYSYTPKNIIFSDLNITYANYGIYLLRSLNNTVENSFILNSTNDGIKLIDFGGNNTIRNNYLFSSGISTKGELRNYIINNTITGLSKPTYPLMIWLDNFTEVWNNTLDISFTENKFSYLYLTRNLFFGGNRVINGTNTTSPLYLESNYNISIYNNTFKGADTCLRLSAKNNYSFIYGNTFSDCYSNTDTYNVGLALNHQPNYFTEVYNNIFSTFGTAGIMARNVTNLSIHDNVFNCMLDSEKLLHNYEDLGEPPTAIGIYEWFKATSGNGYADSNDNYTNISRWQSKNVRIYNNIYNNCSLYFRGNDVANLSYLDGGIYKRFDSPYTIFRNDVWYLNPSFSSIKTYNLGVLSDIMYQRSNKKRYFNYSVTSDYIFVVNTNDSTYSWGFYNQNNILCYYMNGSICGSSNIADNDGQINITLDPDLSGFQTVNAPFTSAIGTVRSDFYGTNTHGSYLTDDGGTTNYTFYQNMFLDTNMKLIRADMGLQTYASASGTFTAYRAKQYRGLIDWAKLNGFKVVWTAGLMPTWLANITVPGAPCSSVNSTCPPSNYTRWEKLITDFLTNVTCDGTVCEIEVWNEPDLSAYLLKDAGGSASANINRSREYNLIYNSTYTAVKAFDPTIKVGGPAILNWSDFGDIFFNNTLANLSTQLDFVSRHRYLYNTEYLAGTTFSDTLTSLIDRSYASCAYYGVNCSNFILSEFNVVNNSLLYMPSYEKEATVKYSEALLYGLNNWPVNLSMVNYQFAGTNYMMINSTSNTTTSSYNATKYISNYCPNGSTVYTSSSNQLKQVTCLRPDGKHSLIVINNESTTKYFKINSTINFHGGDNYKIDGYGVMFIDEGQREGLGGIAYPASYAYIYDNYSILEGRALYTGEPITMSKIGSTSKTVTYQLTSVLDNPVNISIDLIGVTCSASPEVTLITAGGVVYTPAYACVDGQLRITNAIINTSSNNYLRMSYSFLPITGSSCPSYLRGFDNFFSNVPTVFTILGAIMILGFLGLIVFYVKGGGAFDAESGVSMFATVAVILFFLLILAFVFMFITSVIC